MSRLFDAVADDYDLFFSERRDVFLSELAAIKGLALSGEGLDVGMGTGAFTRHLDNVVGVDISRAMLLKSLPYGIRCAQASAERLPFKDGSFGYVLMVTVLCFLEGPQGAISEARRVLRPGGRLAICSIARGSPWGERYELKARSGHALYSHARLFTAEEVRHLMEGARLEVVESISTLHRHPDLPGQGAEPVLRDEKGSFFCVVARKSPKAPAARP
ncbi:MAG: class I SAM-dependent methyltransferase [Methanomassiliicoccales archaeon]|nr:class I SAM-dependent methyltransferase [Methanomassiliicoccales archaeon]